MKQKIANFLFVVLTFTNILYSQSTATGTVKDNSTGVPLPGVSIVVQNTQNGVVTDFDGNFSISNIEAGSTIVFSYLGFESFSYVFNGEINLQVGLVPSNSELEEVVLVGYGSQKKKEVTGAVSVIDFGDIEKLNTSTIDQALQGQVAGVNVSSSSGAPGSNLNIRIRGVSTNGNNNPLILLDGNVIEDLSVVNPNDIQSINILKDATAGIYGVRAANGVILIVTKSGKKNSKLKINLDAFFGIQQTSKKLDLLQPRDYAIFVNEAAAAGNKDPEFVIYPKAGTDWQDEVFEMAPISDLNLNGSFGTNKTAVSFGLSHLDQKGIVGPEKSNFNRITGRMNLKHDLLKNISISSTAIYTHSKRNVLQENSTGSVLFNATNMNPILSIYDSSQSAGYTIADRLGGEIINPLAQIENTYDTTLIDKFSATLGVEYSFLKNFKVTSNLQSNYSVVNSDVFRPEVFYGSSKNATTETNEVTENKDTYMDFTWDNFINYSNTFSEDHNLNVLLGTSAFRTAGKFTGLTGRNLVGNTLADAYVGNALMVTNRYDQASLDREANTFDVRLLSYFSRIQYNYKGKYLFSGMIRRDGSTRFGPNNKFGYFPSASLGWVASEEKFLNDISWISSLKFRMSHGIIGNDRIRDYGFLSVLSGEAVYVKNDEKTTEDLLVGLAEGGLANPNIKWEEQITSNFGIDASFFGDKLDLTLDVFSKRTEDLLISAQVAGVLGSRSPGSSPPVINAGTVENNGVEFSVSYRDQITENLSFNINYNLTKLENEVTFVAGENGFEKGGGFGVGLGIFPSRMEAGQPLGYFYGYKTDGIFQNQDEVDAGPVVAGSLKTLPGDLRFTDIRNKDNEPIPDGLITEEDKTYLGDPIPDLVMGFNFGFNYKDFDLSVSTYASLGVEMIRDYERVELLANKGDYYLNRWSVEGTSTTIPRVTSKASVNNQFFSDYYVEDASYLRIQNVQLGYRLDDSVSSFGLESIRIYLSVNNLHTFTNYLGYDPSATSGAPIGGGIDKGFYPVPRSYFLGLNLKF